MIRQLNLKTLLLEQLPHLFSWSLISIFLGITSNMGMYLFVLCRMIWSASDKYHFRMAFFMAAFFSSALSSGSTLATIFLPLIARLSEKLSFFQQPLAGIFDLDKEFVLR